MNIECKDKITFANLPDQCKISIYTITGELVYEQEFTPTNGKADWNLKNQQGKDVSSGIYLYLITTKTGERIKGKIGVIK